MRVLVTGVGAPGIKGTLYALHHNPDGVPVTVVGTDIRGDAVGRFLVDRFYTLPSPTSDEYLPRLMEICQQEGVSIILPQTTLEAEVLSRVREQLRENGLLVGVSEPAAMAIANNKYQLLRLFAGIGLPVPAYHLAKSEEELIRFVKELGYPNRPVVIKPPVSNGMRGLRILRESAWDAERFLRDKPDGTEITLDELVRILRRGSRWPELLITEFVPGPEFSVDAFRGTRAFVAVSRERVVIRSGITFVARVRMHDKILEYTRRAADAMNLQYAFGFQYKLAEDGTPKVLECNPRIQGTMVTSVFAGHNVIWYTVRELMGVAPTAEELDQVSVREASLYRFWGGVGTIDDEVVDEI